MWNLDVQKSQNFIFCTILLYLCIPRFVWETTFNPRVMECTLPQHYQKYVNWKAVVVLKKKSSNCGLVVERFPRFIFPFNIIWKVGSWIHKELLNLKNWFLRKTRLTYSITYKLECFVLLGKIKIKGEQHTKYKENIKLEIIYFKTKWANKLKKKSS